MVRRPKAYEDTLLDADDAPVYIGDYMGDVPHGQGDDREIDEIFDVFSDGKRHEPCCHVASQQPNHMVILSLGIGVDLNIFNMI